MKITFLSLLCLSACFSLPRSDIVVWVFCFLFPSESTFELLVRGVCVLAAVFPVYFLWFVGCLFLLSLVLVWFDPFPSTCSEGIVNEEKIRDGDDYNSVCHDDEEEEQVVGASVPAIALASATIPAKAGVVSAVGLLSLPAVSAGEQVLDDLLLESLVPGAPADSGLVPVVGFPSGELDFDQVIADLLSGLDGSVLPAGEALFAPAAAAMDDDNSALFFPAGEALFAPAAAAAIGDDNPATILPAAVDDQLLLGLFDVDADFDGIVPVLAANDLPLPVGIDAALGEDPVLNDLLLGLLAFDATLDGLVPALAGADDAPDHGGTETPPLAVTAVAASDVGVVLPPVPVGAAAADDAANVLPPIADDAPDDGGAETPPLAVTAIDASDVGVVLPPVLAAAAAADNAAIVLPPIDDDAPDDGGAETPPLAVTAIDASDVGVVLPPVPVGAAAAADNAAIVLPPAAAIAAPNDGGVVSPGLAAAMPPAAPAVQENDDAVAGEPVPMDVDSDDQDDHILDDPMDIQEDATMTLRRGGWRRVTPLLVHGRRRRIMALPPGVPAHRFAGPYTVPWYQGSSSYDGRRRNTRTGARVKTVF